MTPAEIKSLELYFRKTFDLEEIEVKKKARKQDTAEVYVKGKCVGVIDKDEEDGETAYQFEMEWKLTNSKPLTPAEIKNLEAHLRTIFGLEAIEVRKRAKKQDSVEVFVKEEFIGVIYKDDGDSKVQFQMAILADDLKD
jgi:hypothetical protein